MTSSQASSKERTMGRADVLFKFLQLIGKDRPKDVDKYVKELDPRDERPIVDQVIDLIIAGDEQGYEKYSQARKQFNLGSPHMEKTAPKETLPEFLEKWIKFEIKLRAIAVTKLRNYTGPLSETLLRKLEIFSEDDLQMIDALQDLRNQVVHGTGAPKSVIAEAEKRISELLNRLEGQYPLVSRRKPRNSSVKLERGLKVS